ncbi:MAG TPA: hypothetical protein VMU48_17325 [Terracidiphilus sp.]|nr:hypothetical protein [Terracidiphilus sp.]
MATGLGEDFRDVCVEGLASDFELGSASFCRKSKRQRYQHLPLTPG